MPYGRPLFCCIPGCCLTEVEVEVMNKKTKKSTGRRKDVDQKRQRRALALTLRSDFGLKKSAKSSTHEQDFAEAAKPRPIQVFQTGMERLRSIKKNRVRKSTSKNQRRAKPSKMQQHVRWLKDNLGGYQRDPAVAMSGGFTKSHRYGLIALTIVALSVGLGGWYLSTVHNWQKQDFLSTESWRTAGPATLKHIKKVKVTKIFDSDFWGAGKTENAKIQGSRSYRKGSNPKRSNRRVRDKITRTKRLESPGVARKIKAQQQRQWEQKLSKLNQQAKRKYKKAARRYRHSKTR